MAEEAASGLHQAAVVSLGQTLLQHAAEVSHGALGLAGLEEQPEVEVAVVRYQFPATRVSMLQ